VAITESVEMKIKARAILAVKGCSNNKVVTFMIKTINKVIAVIIVRTVDEYIWVEVVDDAAVVGKLDIII
jgi:hypothetical protein